VDNAVVYHKNGVFKNGVFVLDLPDEGLDDLPEVLAGHGLSRQEARDLIMAQARVQQAG